MTGPRDLSWLDAADEPYEPMPLRHGLAILAVVAYGGLLVFLLGDGRYGWFSVAVGVPSGLYFAAVAACRTIRRHIDCALVDPSDVATVERNYQSGGWATR